jgi:uncharacterized protein YbaR (Trm112 family)
MRKDLAAIVCCPVHKTGLKLTVTDADEHGDIVAGTLRCTTCKFDYPIEEGIPNLLPPAYHVDEVRGGSAPKGSPPRQGGPLKRSPGQAQGKGKA